MIFTSLLKLLKNKEGKVEIREEEGCPQETFFFLYEITNIFEFVCELAGQWFFARPFD